MTTTCSAAAVDRQSHFLRHSHSLRPYQKSAQGSTALAANTLFLAGDLAVTHVDIEVTNVRPIDSDHENAELDSQPQLSLQLEDSHLSFDKDELSAIAEATGVVCEQSDRFGKMKVELEADIANQQERNATLEEVKFQAEKALEEATTQLKTLEENCDTARAAARQVQDALTQLQGCMYGITKANVTDSLKKTIVEQETSAESK